MASDQAKAIMDELNKLTVEQVRQVKEQVDGEMGLLQDSLNRIRTAAVRYEMASKALHKLSAHTAGCRRKEKYSGSSEYGFTG